jgi:uncharacterized protein involved in response to NO
MQSRVFASGFRPTFLAAGVAAVVLVPLWVLVWGFGWSLSTGWPPTMWHAHEMVFGFIAAAIAGFLLTAVPSWTGQRGFAGWPLVLLMALWVAARVLVATAAQWPAILVGAVDVAFLLALASLVAPSLLRSQNRNTPLLAVLALLAASNAVSHWALAHRDAGFAYHAILIGIDIALLLVTVIGGRILPAFTANALRSSGAAVAIRAWPWITPAAVIMMIAVGVTDILWLNSPASGIVAGIAAVVQAVRMLQWRSFATRQQPIVWVLHLAYGWLPAGLALKSVALLQGAAFSAVWLHALTVGVLATMIMAVMTRASLGHTGRALVVDPTVTAGYLLLLGAGVVRVFGLGLLGLPYTAVVVISAACWTAAFGIFLVNYAPILWFARADGKPG